MSSESKVLLRDVEASVVPIGTKVTLQKGESAYISQSLGGSYTVIVNGNMFRIDSQNADALGLEVRVDVSNGGFRWVTVGAPDQDVDIVLFQPHGGRSQAEGDALLSLVLQGSLQAAIFRSDDLDATFEQVRASGAEILEEPADRPWGARDCAVRDPSGNLVRIAQA